MTAAPALAREQILRCCARQFEEGDVQHWWHPPHGAGVRTRITDDLLWLPYAAHRYVQITGDESLWDKKVPYLHAPPLDSNQQQRYDTPEVSDQTGSVREHCQRAVQMVIDRGLGPHGLALMGAVLCAEAVPGVRKHPAQLPGRRRTRLGRGLVPPGLLRRRNAPGFPGERPVRH